MKTSILKEKGEGYWDLITDLNGHIYHTELEEYEGDFIYPLSGHLIDVWGTVSGKVDFNIYIEEDGTASVSYYPVVDGQINTQDTSREGLELKIQTL